MSPLATASLVCWLGGCCLSEIHGVAVNGGSAGASSSGAATSSTGSSSSTNGSTSGTTGGSGATTTSGTSGTTTGAPPPFGVLLDAGANAVFGPVALAAIPDGGNEVARLVYSEGDGGQFGIMLETLDSKGRPLGDTLQLATTGDEIGMNSFSESSLDYPSAPPNVTVADDGTTTTVCWEDFSTISNPAAPQACQSGAMGSVRCASVPDDGSSPDASYSNCGSSPRLVFNPGGAGGPAGGSTQLFFLELPNDQLVEPPIKIQAVAEWAVGQPPSVNQIVIDAGSVLVAAALPGGRAGAIYSNYTFSPPAQVLWLESTGFADGGYLPTDRSPIDPDYWTYGAYATPFAAAGEPSAGTAAILEYDGSQLLAFVWQLDLGAPQQIVVPSTEPPEGAIAVGICPKGYVYLATTIRGHVLLAEGTFDGGIGAVPSRYLTLPDFDPTPGLLQRDNSGIARPATSMALAPTPDGKLLLAISNPWQVAVYLEDCE